MWLKPLSSLLSSQFYMPSFRKAAGLLCLCLALLLMSWESQKVDASLLQTAIPDESIRLRILANSDSPQDQAIKMLVRDRVVAKMNSWATETASIEDARAYVALHLDDMKSVIADVLAENGIVYTFDAALSEVEFPTKSYGGVVYPAGQYEALLISLGEAEGRNWWCVLFPPLCFVDTVSGEATTARTVNTTTMTLGDEVVEADAVAEEDATSGETGQKSDEEADIEVKFFFADAWAWFKGLFV